ncbi:hypothetical protein IL306_006180 [Fusarium sp. DS 682]|nr:hypothetical protein IL306_006180 [Fusarium sp. DS 682]
MAIHPDVPGLSVTVEVNHSPLPERERPIEETRPSYVAHGTPYVERSIECSLGSKYAVAMTLTSSYAFPDDHDLLMLRLYLDDSSSHFRTLMVSKASIPELGSDEKHVEYLKFRDHRGTDGQVHRTFLIFSKVSSAEGGGPDEIAADLERLKSMGTIRAKVMTAKDEGKEMLQEPPPPRDFASLEVFGKALIQSGQDVAVGTSFATVKMSKEWKERPCTRVSNETNLVTFVFYYRNEGKSLYSK